MRKYGTAQDPHVEVEQKDPEISKTAASQEWTTEDEQGLQDETGD